MRSPLFVRPGVLLITAALLLSSLLVLGQQVTPEPRLGGNMGFVLILLGVTAALLAALAFMLFQSRKRRGADRYDEFAEAGNAESQELREPALWARWLARFSSWPAIQW